MALHSPLTELVAKARRRFRAHLLFQQLILTAAIVLGGAVIVLLTGTQALSWFWLVLLAAVSFGTGVFLMRKRLPSEYEAAQRIDGRLRLADTLSTAVFFSGASGDASESLRAAQHLQADEMAGTVNLKTAFPYHPSRALYPALALALAVAGIFLLRYQLLGSFDPRTPLVQNAYDTLFHPPAKPARASSLPEDGELPGDGREQSKDLPKNNDFAGDPTGNADPTLPDKKNELPATQADNKTKKPDAESNGKGAEEPPSNNDKKSGDKQADGKQNAKSQPDPSLLSKVREALNDMLSKMKSSPDDAGKSQKDDPQSEQQAGPEGQSQDKSDNQSSQEGKKSSDAKDGSNNAPNKPSQDQQTGFGSQEGDKTAKQAEALKAMGKISELLGKRAENVKGAVMVEVGSTKQQLKTQVTQSQASHGEAGSEIHRDEVPRVYEQFVQQYFEQIRKPSSPARPAPASPSKQ
jgi:hypothetical protein